MRTQLDSARAGGAYECAPEPLARAETQAEFLGLELEQGNAMRATVHRDDARLRLETLLATMKALGCRKEQAPPPAPKPSDRDGDGVIDDHDACPDEPGPREFAGCPDRDGDRIPDKSDRCPDRPEDFDGHLDEDGCPESEDRDGDGVLDEVDDCPDTPGPKDNHGCPLRDRDRDGILDADDKCVDDPEDRDNFEDSDGCPDDDNDKDGILDPKDKCRDLPETPNGFEDSDGCPDINPELVVVNLDLGKIEIKQKVFFEFAKAIIRKQSHPLLNEVGAAIKSLPEGKRVIVEGHTDSVGADPANKKLSQARANAVRTYLIGRGIDPELLEARGYGEERPIASNRSEAGRDKNRRVEFTIE
ncbi:MAG: OmpA family protein [Deltaproteobacteria bacterium]|nr:OmpA family protein [Deltaproteobacteria bacterium]